MPDMYISVASQAAEKNWLAMGVSAESSKYIDHWHIMNYDYTVSDIQKSQPMSPNQPLYNPPAPAVQWSINYTVQGYLNLKVPPEKIMIGLSLYGHTWYKSDMSDWKKFGESPEKQSKCFGPFKDTYGGAPGKGCQQCGVMMNTEIEAAECENYFDNKTQSDIAYCTSSGADQYTAAGIWITWQSVASNQAVVDYGKSLGVAGFFTFDATMDGKYKYHKAIRERMNNPHPTPAPTPTPGPKPASFKCVDNACVAAEGGVPESICESVCGSVV